MIISVLSFIAPLTVLVVAGAIAVSRLDRGVRVVAVALAMVSTVAWLACVALLPDEHVVGTVPVIASFVVPAAWTGWRRLAPPVIIGGSLAFGPMVLAGWTAPRGDNDGLWTLVFLMLAGLGALAAGVAVVAGHVAVARRHSADGQGPRAMATPPDQLAAVAVDVVVVGSVLVVPLTKLSHAKLEVVAGVLGVVVATAILAVPMAWKGRTLGQALVGLTVLDAETHGRITTARAFLRSLVTVLEIPAAWTVFLAIPAILEWISLSESGRTYTDRFLGTVVMSKRRADEP